jgi:hypothetical protein
MLDLDTPQLVQTAAQLTAVIPVSVSRAEIGRGAPRVVEAVAWARAPRFPDDWGRGPQLPAVVGLSPSREPP